MAVSRRRVIVKPSLSEVDLSDGTSVPNPSDSVFKRLVQKMEVATAASKPPELSPREVVYLHAVASFYQRFLLGRVSERDIQSIRDDAYELEKRKLQL